MRLSSYLTGGILIFGLTIMLPGSAAWADDAVPYSGSDQMGTANDGSATESDQSAGESIQQQTDDMKSRWGGDAQRNAVENGVLPEGTDTSDSPPSSPAE